MNKTSPPLPVLAMLGEVSEHAQGMQRSYQIETLERTPPSSDRMPTAGASHGTFTIGYGLLVVPITTAALLMDTTRHPAYRDDLEAAVAETPRDRFGTERPERDPFACTDKSKNPFACECKNHLTLFEQRLMGGGHYRCRLPVVSSQYLSKSCCVAPG